MAREIIDFTQGLLSSIGTAQSCLGDAALPHVSLAHVNGPMTAEEVWQDVAPVIDNEATILTTGLRFDIYTPYNSPAETAGGLLVYLTVAFDGALARLRDQLMRTSWISSGTVVYGQPDQFYDPHFTLGTTTPASGPIIRGDVVLPTRLIRQRLDCTLHVGPIGAHGVFQQSLAGVMA